MTAEGGVRDWDEKLALFRPLLGVQTNKMLVTKILRGTEYSRYIGTIASTNLGKWRNSRPEQEVSQFFFDTLAVTLPTKDCVNSSLLISMAIEDYVDHLPDDEQTTAILNDAGFRKRSVTPHPDSASGLDVLQTFEEDGLFPIWFFDQGQVETIRTGLQKGRIDQKHYYIDSDSASAWSALVRADAYPTYGDCKTGLESLMKSPHWKNSLTKCKPSTIVMLAGGGAPTKDLVFFQDLLGQSYVKGRVHLHLVDISDFMLRDSRRAICEHARFLGFKDRVELGLFCGDVLKMNTCMLDRFHEHGNAIFAITGGTIGNFSEKAFFGSLDRVASPGDLLVVSADTIDELSRRDKEVLINKYNNADLRRFLQPVVRSVLTESNVIEPIGSVLEKRIKVELLEGRRGPSDVPSSCSVIVTVGINAKPITLVTSTRYQSSELIAFAAGFGWEPVCQIPSTRNIHFKQFLFHRNNSETAGIESVP
jgi:hypothetical protein